jgi:hypothetical protein
MTALLQVERDETQCEAQCPIHGTRCKLRRFEQQAFPMHAHMIDGKTCLWKKQ